MKVLEHHDPDVAAYLGGSLPGQSQHEPDALSSSPTMAREAEQDVIPQATDDETEPGSGTDLSARQEYQSYQQLVDRTIDVFGDAIKASLWLSQPSPDFGGKVPLQIAQEVQYRPEELEELFEPIFVRIEHGIYW